MAYCQVMDLPGFGKAIVRMSGRRPKPCDFCGDYHTKLCDALVDRKTCDAKMCDKHATPSGKHDFCPNHKELA